METLDENTFEENTLLADTAVEFEPVPCSGDVFGSTVVGITLAGAAYPSVMVLCITPFALGRITSIGDFGTLLIGALNVVFLGALAGFFCAFVAGLVSTVLVTFFDHTLGGIWSGTITGAVSGGLAGYSCLMWPFVEEFHPVFFLAGPVMAMACGEIGGAKAAHAATCRRVLWERIRNGSQNVSKSEGRSPLRVRFGLRQMMIVTAWTSGLLALVRLTGEYATRVLLLLAIWGVLQTATILIGSWIVRRPPRWVAWVFHLPPAAASTDD